jgi:LysM repeat protein
MQITHEEARKLIQFSLDQLLKPQEKNTLQIHLEDCMECRSFFADIKDVEKHLVPAMARHWNLRPIPLSLASLNNKKKLQQQSSIILATRTVIISIVFVAFIFSAWQFSSSYGRSSTPVPVSLLPIPTPSGQSTSTQVSFQNCQEMRYQVQENDTLESIAIQFSIAKDKLMAINNLGTESLSAKTELLIPVCNSTPMGTVHPSTLTTTFTPLFGPTTSTPGGS